MVEDPYFPDFSIKKPPINVNRFISSGTNTRAPHIQAGADSQMDT